MTRVEPATPPTGGSTVLTIFMCWLQKVMAVKVGTVKKVGTGKKVDAEKKLGTVNKVMAVKTMGTGKKVIAVK